MLPEPFERLDGFAASILDRLADRFTRRRFARPIGERLLDIDILAGLTGPNRRQGVPVVRRGRRDGVVTTG